MLFKRVEKHQRIGGQPKPPAEDGAKEMLFIGGVATQNGMVKALEDRLGIKSHGPARLRVCCAIGAALLGLKRLEARAEN
jgi:activator of 2-hydroxyglutaryl-CoA dehydratase